MYPLRRVAFLLITALTLPTGASAQRAAGEKLVFVVRHAEKANATEQDPSLSDIGRARAIALAVALRDAGVSEVFVTQRKRTRETAAVLTAARQLTAHVVPFGASTPDHAAAVAAAVRQATGNAVLVVGHSNTVTRIVAALGGPRLPELCDAAYSNLFIVRLPARGSPTFVRAHFGAPDPADAGTCAAATMR
ncbi:MAG: histidine phosphatase family protein [Gemmatimonadaceae bacterium]